MCALLVVFVYLFDFAGLFILFIVIGFCWFGLTTWFVLVFTCLQGCLTCFTLFSCALLFIVLLVIWLFLVPVLAVLLGLCVLSC